MGVLNPKGKCYNERDSSNCKCVGDICPPCMPSIRLVCYDEAGKKISKQEYDTSQQRNESDLGNGAVAVPSFIGLVVALGIMGYFFVNYFETWDGS